MSVTDNGGNSFVRSAAKDDISGLAEAHLSPQELAEDLEEISPTETTELLSQLPDSELAELDDYLNAIAERDQGAQLWSGREWSVKRSKPKVQHAKHKEIAGSNRTAGHSE